MGIRFARLWLVMGLALLLGGLAASAAAGAVRASSCASCHREFKSLLPDSHPAVAGKDIGACWPCHTPKAEEAAGPNPFSAKLHRAHVDPKRGVECTLCHTWSPGKQFGFQKQKGTLGAPGKGDMARLASVMRSWAGSGFLDGLHAKQQVSCAGCHGAALPVGDDVSVESARCLACHGPAEKLAERSESREHPKRNPHRSHVVNLSCTKCHQGHAASKVYCLDCHKAFDMKIPGGG